MDQAIMERRAMAQIISQVMAPTEITNLGITGQAQETMVPVLVMALVLVVAMGGTVIPTMVGQDLALMEILHMDMALEMMLTQKPRWMIMLNQRLIQQMKRQSSRTT
jgi:hypothetical protein